MPVVVGSDGLRARDNGPWGEEKLAFLSRFAPVALTATRRIPQRHYVDLFAGPGLNKIRGSSQEFSGSPIRVIEMVSDRPPDTCFTHAWFVNYVKADHKALQTRVDRELEAGRSRIARENLHCIHGDANHEVYRIMEAIPTRSFVFALTDMDAPSNCHWSTVAALRTHGQHTSVDLYILFPLEMAINRLISRRHATVEESAPALDRFYGDARWRELLKYRLHDSTWNSQALRQEALKLYCDRLREHWSHVDVVADIRRGTHHRLYKMIYASNHDAGKKIAQWAKKRSRDQGSLDL